MSIIRLQIFISVSLLLFSSFNTSAQDEMGWPVEQRCLGEPTAPPEGWTFEGTIFTQNYEGIRGVNSRIKTPYFIIFDDGFAYGASASPDGRWYAVPAGRVTNATMVDYWFIVEEIRVYSTDGRRELYTLPWNITFRGGGGYAVRQIRYSSSFVVILNYHTPEGDFSWELSQFNREGKLSDVIYHSSNNAWSGKIVLSTDGKYIAFVDSGKLHLADTEEEHVLDLCIELGLARMAWSPTHNLLAFTYDESITIFDAEMWQMHNMEFRIGDVVGWGAAG